MLALLGFAMVGDRGLAARLSTSEAVLLPIGALALIQAYRVVRGRMRTTIALAETGDPETEQTLAVPGDDFDEIIDRIHRGSRTPFDPVAAHPRMRTHVVRNRDRLNQRLETAAIATISNKWGCSEARAREAIQAGSWTDDPHAAAFFTGEIEDIGFPRRIVNAIAAEGRYQRRANRAAAAIATLAEEDATRVRTEVPRQ